MGNKAQHHSERENSSSEEKLLFLKETWTGIRFKKQVKHVQMRVNNLWVRHTFGSLRTGIWGRPGVLGCPARCPSRTEEGRAVWGSSTAWSHSELRPNERRHRGFTEDKRHKRHLFLSLISHHWTEKDVNSPLWNFTVTLKRCSNSRHQWSSCCWGEEEEEEERGRRSCVTGVREEPPDQSTASSAAP